MSSSSADQQPYEDAIEEEEAQLTGSASEDDDDGAPVSPLAMMNENSPEAWLGQFPLALGMATPRGTVEGARRDATLIAGLTELRASLVAADPLVILDADRAAGLRARDWGAWWRAQDNLGRYANATLALSLLGSRDFVADLAAMYRQTYNARLQKDAHYVLTYMLGKQWPSYHVTDADLARLEGGS
ncbi:MAG: hypothetical protein ACJ78Q_20270 [Chloroflexia bacterium]